MTVSVLTTKLYIPATPLNLVRRERLVELLNKGLQRRLILVSAPAGYGKTTLISEWISTVFAAHPPVAWLSLDSGDNDSFRFWSYLLSAMGNLRGEDNGDASSKFSTSQLSEEALIALINQVIVDIRRDFVLVLDDYHCITNPVIHKAITFLLDYSPAQLHMVIASREEPPLPLALFRAREQLIELRADELRFTVEEAQAFIHLLSAFELPSNVLEELHSRTEGWIAGLQLAILSMRETVDAENFTVNLTGSHRYIADFLVEEVLKRQPEAICSFLLQTSVLDRMCAPLCDALIGDRGKETEVLPQPLSLASLPAAAFESSQQILEYLERANLFIVPLDDNRYWYRYHHLFSDVLQDRLRAKNLGHVLDLHKIAAEWFKENGYYEDALDHWLAAGDVTSASTLVVKNAATLLSRGEVPVLLNWIHKLPETEIRSNPWLAIFYAAGLSLTGQPHLCETFLAEAERKVPVADLPEAREMLGYIASLRAQMAIASIRVEEALEQAHRALDYLPEENLAMRSLVSYTLGDVCILNDDADGADKAFDDAARMAQGGMNFYISVAAVCAQARVKMLQGELYQADHFFQEAQRLASEAGEYKYRMMDYGYAWMADLRREMNAISEARSIITEAMEYFQKMRSKDAILLGCAFLACIHQSSGDHEAAFEALNKAQELARKHNLDQVNVFHLRACQVRAWIRKGNLGEASLCMERWQNGSVPTVGYLRHLQAIAHARLLAAQGKTLETLELLEPLEVEIESKGLYGILIEILVLKSLALAAQGNIKSSLMVLEKALRLAIPRGYFRIFLDEGAPLANLLHRLLSRKDETIKAFASKLLDAFRKERKGKPARAAKEPYLFDPIESLGERELQILRLIAEGRSYQEIAQILIIAVGTVQYYIKSLYAKLQVHSGLEAVARAREIGLLS